MDGGELPSLLMGRKASRVNEHPAPRRHKPLAGCMALEALFQPMRSALGKTTAILGYLSGQAKIEERCKLIEGYYQ